ncbi:hypothetical protein Tdes44962_MAKER09462 [Teratosphaeria destructans]|uniref:2EXR domain-containing protein n=1 Tax=Teratosphaeria destructans TaxID=418781 RepID=A0A9W7ST57_9PEZI|nr:hypothetical protein Tdes44962_MAKER09462 [Teratosphaeria destructans]
MIVKKTRRSASERPVEKKRKTARNLLARHASPRPETPNLLMTLPAELRNNIYEFVLRTIRVLHVRDQQFREPALLRVSKEIRSEALPLYYGTNRFSIYLNLGEERNLGRLVDWLQSIVRDCRSSTPFGAWNISFWCGDYLAVLGMLPLFHLFHTGWISHDGVAPPTVASSQDTKRSAALSSVLPQPFFRRSSELILDSRGRGDRTLQGPEPLGELLDRLLVLADHAREKAWGEEEFERWFKQAVAQKSAFGKAKALNALVAKRAREKRAVVKG